MLICVDCKSDLSSGENHLKCNNCNRKYLKNNSIVSMMPSAYQKQNDKNIKIRQESYDYWNGGIPGTVSDGYQKDYVKSPPKSKAWFLEGDEFRYKNYKYLHDFCEFSTYKNKKVLDIGPGRGQETHNYERAGAHLSVLEYAEQGVNLLAERKDIFDLDYEIFHGDAISLPFKEETFDLVFSYGVLHHIPSIDKAISEVSRVLRKGGEAKIMIYHKGYFYYKTMFLKWYLLKGNFIKYSWNDYIKIAMEQREGPCPVVFIYSMKEIFSLFENTGLKIKKYYNAEIIDGRLVRWHILPSWFINKYSNFLGAYCHITLEKL